MKQPGDAALNSLDDQRRKNLEVRVLAKLRTVSAHFLSKALPENFTAVDMGFMADEDKIEAKISVGREQVVTLEINHEAATQKVRFELGFESRAEKILQIVDAAMDRAVKLADEAALQKRMEKLKPIFDEIDQAAGMEL